MLIMREHPQLSVSEQCALVGLSRSSYYYCAHKETALNRTLLRLLDEQYTRTPFYGVAKMTQWLRHAGYAVNGKRVRRLLRQLGLMAVYPKPHLSGPRDEPAVVSPYLLKGLAISRPNQVWAADITYIRLSKGFAYLMAILDWHSRYVVSWELSLTLEAEFCVMGLQAALAAGQRPSIFNSDQGSQFTSAAFTDVLVQHEIAISRDGRGRAFDNIMVERLWRTVKYEEVYLRDYANPQQAQEHLAEYFEFYNQQRYHTALDYQTPAEVYYAAA